MSPGCTAIYVGFITEGCTVLYVCYRVLYSNLSSFNNGGCTLNYACFITQSFTAILFFITVDNSMFTVLSVINKESNLECST